MKAFFPILFFSLFFNLSPVYAFIGFGGDCSYEVFEKDASFNGLYKHYSKDGSLRYETNFKNGKLNGSYKVYKGNGFIACEMLFKDGENINTIDYDENGFPIEKAGSSYNCYFRDDVPRSLIGDWGWEVFYGRCNQNEPGGLNRCFNHQKENLVFKWNCSNHQIQDAGIEYYRSGVKRQEYNFDKSQLKRLIQYNKQGIKIAEYDFDDDGRKQSVEYDDSGKLKRKSESKVEKDSDKRTNYEYVQEYAEDGSLKDQYHYKFEFHEAIDGCGLKTTGVITKKIKEDEILKEDTYVFPSGTCDVGGGNIIGLEKN